MNKAPAKGSSHSSGGPASNETDDNSIGDDNSSCQAADDVAYPMGDPREASTKAALDFLAGRSCGAAIGDAGLRSATAGGRRELLTPARPDTAQREVPGLL